MPAFRTTGPHFVCSLSNNCAKALGVSGEGRALSCASSVAISCHFGRIAVETASPFLGLSGHSLQTEFVSNATTTRHSRAECRAGPLPRPTNLHSRPISRIRLSPLVAENCYIGCSPLCGWEQCKLASREQIPEVSIEANEMLSHVHQRYAWRVATLPLPLLRWRSRMMSTKIGTAGGHCPSSG